MPVAKTAHLNRPRSIRRSLYWLIFASLVPAILGAVALLINNYRTGRTQIEGDAISVARALSQAVDAEFAKARLIAESLAQ